MFFRDLVFGTKKQGKAKRSNLVRACLEGHGRGGGAGSFLGHDGILSMYVESSGRAATYSTFVLIFVPLVAARKARALQQRKKKVLFTCGTKIVGRYGTIIVFVVA